MTMTGQVPGCIFFNYNKDLDSFREDFEDNPKKKPSEKSES